jgi:hypothetical protein
MPIAVIVEGRLLMLLSLTWAGDAFAEPSEMI